MQFPRTIPPGGPSRLQRSQRSVVVERAAVLLLTASARETRSPPRAYHAPVSRSSPLRPLSQGRRLASARIGSVRFLETRHPPGLALAPHVHARPAITLVLEGCFRERFGRVAHECRPLDLLFKPSGAEHDDQYGTRGARSLLIELEPEAERRLAPFVRFDALRARARGGLAGAQGLRLLDTLRARDHAAVALVEEMTLELVDSLADRLDYATTGAPPAWLRAVRDAVHDRWREPVTLTDLAEEAGVHPVYLARAFRRQYGRPVGRYLRRLRVEHAADGLSRTDLCASAVALESGFCDQSHLNRVFRRETGWAPVGYRQAVRRLTEHPSAS